MCCCCCCCLMCLWCARLLRYFRRCDCIRETLQLSSERMRKFIRKAVHIPMSTSFTPYKMRMSSVSTHTQKHYTSIHLDIHHFIYLHAKMIRLFNLYKRYFFYHFYDNRNIYLRIGCTKVCSTILLNIRVL